MSADAGGVLSEDEGFANLTSDRSIPMTDEAISPLRRRMIEDMTIRQFAPKTQQGYVASSGTLRRFSAARRIPAERRGSAALSAASGRHGVAVPNGHGVSALRFFFKVTLERPGIGERMHGVVEPRSCR